VAEHGARVAVLDLERAEPATAAAKLGTAHIGVVADVTDKASCDAAIAAVLKTFGRIDVLINNAGILTVAPFEQLSLDDFDHMVAVNVRAVFAAAQEASRHMGEGGRIITIGSVNADRIPFAGGAVYAMTKAAVAGLTRGPARDLGPRGITVNTVQPGPIDTEMNPAEGPFAEGLKAMIALGRYGQTDEIAGMVSYLASPEAGYITGASLKIDGGFAA
jgi:3-oxoacyl-[acyl-carrier protein] reductase